MSWESLYRRMREVAARYSNCNEHETVMSYKLDRDMMQIEKEARELADSEKEEFVCCGKPVVGAEYMGQKEMICCGNPERK